MRHTILLQAVTPIAHGDTVTGIDNQTNTRIFMRQGMIVDGKPGRVPSISENALRAVLFRNPLHDDLLSRLAIGRGELPQSVVNLLFSGGNMAAGSKAPGDEMALGHQIKRLYPSLDLLGGAVDGFILPRSRLRMAAWLVAREYAPALRLIAPDLVGEAEGISAYDMLTEETRTRGTGAESDGNQMLYTYETLAAGAKLLVEVSLDMHTPEATRASVAHAIACWDGYIGGQGRQGRGRMAVLASDLVPADAYLAHVEASRDAMRQGLTTGRLGTEKLLCAPK
jgi:hypothetical protein